MGLERKGSDLTWDGDKIALAKDITPGTTVLIPKGAIPVPAYIDMRAIPTAWGTANSTGGLISSYNSSAVAAGGALAVTFDTPMDNADYSVSANINYVVSSGVNSVQELVIASTTTTGFIAKVFYESGSFCTPTKWFFQVIGGKN